MNNKDVNEFINKYLSEEYKQIIKSDDVKKIASFKCDKEHELRTMRIHLENAKRSGLKVEGINELIAALQAFPGKEINIINIRNRSFYFKVYSDAFLNEYLGCVAIKLRKKTPEEVRWGRDVLGIKSPPPDIKED